MTALLAFIALVLPVVAVHEFGHYLAARFFGVRVLRFSVGFGKPLAVRTDSAGTEWALAPILLGGYVRLLDRETAAEANLPDGGTMEAQNNWRRFVIYAAGPLANLVFAAVILTGVLMAGETGLSPRIGGVLEDSPAARAGFLAGDKIVRVNGEEAPVWRLAAAAMADAALSGEEILAETDGGARRIPAGELRPADVQEGLLRAAGVLPDTGYLTQTVGTVAPGSAAEKAGILPGDVIVAVDDAVPETWREMAEEIASRPGLRVPVILWRGGGTVSVEAEIESVGKGERRTGRLGVTPQIDREKLSELLVTVRMDALSAAPAAVRKTWEGLLRTFRFVGHMLGGNLSFGQNVSGPVGIAVGAGAAAEAGLLAWWSFAALISISLAAVNLLPLPILDGGQMVLCAVQSVLRRPLSKRLVAGIDRAGLAALLVLMVAALGADLARLL